MHGFIIAPLSVIENPECNSEEQSRLQNALLTLYTIATKHGVSNNVLRTFLAEENLREDSIEDLLEHYDHSKGAIRLKLAKYGHPIPWATNVNWKLSSVLRTSGSDEMNADLVYKITFEGAGPTGRTILTNFDCTLEELQNLSLKFKEIERNCHRIAENE